MDRISMDKSESSGSRFEELNKIKLILQKELDSLIKDSEITTNLERADANNWNLTVSVKLPRGQLGVKKKGADLKSLFQQTVEEIKMKYQIMKLNNEKESFQFDKVNEFDFYSQVCAAPTPQESKMKVLLLEDDPASEKVLENAFHQIGFAVESFSTPDQALQAFSDKSYDLLVLDWNLPFMSGENFLTEADKIQKNKSKKKLTKIIPTIICSCYKKNDIKIPKLDSFFILDFWNKSMPFSSVVNSLELATKKITNL